jgi:hypothetical protein
LKENEARFYDSQIGRFLTPNPAGTIDSPNLYAYVLGDPVNNTDPSGLEAEDEGEEIVVTGRRRSGLGLFFGAFSSGGNIGSGSFFHFLDPFADNSSQGPGTGEMMMCSVGRDASATQALANADGNLRAQQEIFRQFTNELSGDLFAEASRLYGEFAAGAVGFGVLRLGYITGYEIKIGNNLRVALFGNRTGDPIGRFPHYHRRVIDSATGKTKPGQGIGRHRPFETKTVNGKKDGFCDRF